MQAVRSSSGTQERMRIRPIAVIVGHCRPCSGRVNHVKANLRQLTKAQDSTLVPLRITRRRLALRVRMR